MIALLDNQDSFTYNLVHYLEELDQEVIVIDKTQAQNQNALFHQASHIIISPGPGHPSEAVQSLEVIREYHKKKPILGVCLGHQCIALYFKGEIQKGKEPVQGKTSNITFINNPLFRGITQNTEVMRYHSLIVSSISAELEPLAWSEDQVIMALRHKTLPVYGVQFHPESILTKEGKKILSNFLKI